MSAIHHSHGEAKLFLKAKPCRLHTLGMCVRGTACKFAHGADGISQPQDFSKTEFCGTYFATGFCVDGPTCKFAHWQDELRPPLASHSHSADYLTDLSSQHPEHQHEQDQEQQQHARDDEHEQYFWPVQTQKWPEQQALVQPEQQMHQLHQLQQLQQQPWQHALVWLVYFQAMPSGTEMVPETMPFGMPLVQEQMRQAIEPVCIGAQQPESVLRTSSSVSTAVRSRQTAYDPQADHEIHSLHDSGWQCNAGSEGSWKTDFSEALDRLSTISWNTTVKNTFLEFDEHESSMDKRRVQTSPALPRMIWSEADDNSEGEER